MEKSKILKKLRPKFPKVSVGYLHQLIEKQFQLMTGSVMSKASLKSVLSERESKPGPIGIVELKELGVATSEKAKQSKVCLVTPKISKGKNLFFSKNKPAPLAAGHFGLMVDFSYKKNRPRSD